jgi:hypothetical protein
MASYRGVAAIAAATGVAVVGAVQIARSPADAVDRGRVRSAATPSAPSTVGGDFMAPTGKQQLLLAVPGIGRFTARCRPDERLRGQFASTSDETLFVAVEPGGGQPRSAAVDPGKQMSFPASDGSMTTQRWQLTSIGEPGRTVTLVFVASSPAYGGDPPVCAVSAYAIGPKSRSR